VGLQIAAGTVIDDRYEVLGRIGAGAVAVVHLARHLHLGTLHALKVLLVPTPFVQRRLLQEGRLQSGLRDRNVVTVTDVVDVEGAPGLVMNYVRGPSLERFLQHAHLDPQQARALGAGMLMGVRAAHAHGLVHRDLKPANVLIDVDATSLVPKIADFGLAKILVEDGGPTATRAGTILGTPAYMAPEQIRDARSVDERADVFSLGAVLYELLTSRRVFPGDDLLDLYDRIREGRYTPVRQLVPEVPPEVEAVVDDALRVERDHRIANVAELLDRWTQGLGEGAAEIDWPESLLTLAEGLAPGPQSGSHSGLSGAGLSAATFDLAPDGSRHGADSVEVPGEDVVGEPLCAAVIVEQTAHGLPSDPSPSGGPTPTLVSPPRPPRPALSRVRRRWRLLARWGAVGAVLVASMVCVGTVGTVAAGFVAGWLQWGPSAPPPPMEAVRRSLYTATQAPRLWEQAGVETDHVAGWLALRDGDADRALEALERVATDRQKRDDGSLQLLFAAAMSLRGDPEAYRRIELASKLAGTRRGPTHNLARLATDCLAGTATPRDVERHFAAYPDDLLARVLLAGLEGFDGESRLALARQLTELDPQHALGWSTLARLTLNRGQLGAAAQVLDDGLAAVPKHPELLALRARLELLQGLPHDARRRAETLGTVEQMPVTAVGVYAGALRTLQDTAGVEAAAAQLADDDARTVAFALGAAEAAFGMGAPKEAFDWAESAFARASTAGRLADAVEVARELQAMAVLVEDPESLERAVRDAGMATALVGLPPLLHHRVTPRILLLNGLLAIEQGDVESAQRTIARLEEVDRGERQAALLRGATLAAQGVVPPAIEAPASGCLVRSLDARWRSRSGPDGDYGALFRLILADGSPCAHAGLDRYVRADAEVRLAVIALSLGDTAGARSHLTAFRSLAPDPEFDSPLFGLLSEVEEELAWFGSDQVISAPE
jgi:serine/threonine protein kinase/tetratricopeptide (TPR) repeat protein